MEKVVPKMARRRGSDAWQSRRWVRFCRWCPQALQEKFSFLFILQSVRGQKKAVTVASKY